MRELKLDEPRLDRLDEALVFVDGLLEDMDCPMKTQMQIDVAVVELYVNIAHDACAPVTGSRAGASGPPMWSTSQRPAPSRCPARRSAP